MMCLLPIQEYDLQVVQYNEAYRIVCLNRVGRSRINNMPQDPSTLIAGPLVNVGLVKTAAGFFPAPLNPRLVVPKPWQLRAKHGASWQCRAAFLASLVN